VSIDKIITSGCSFCYRNYDYENPERASADQNCIIEDEFGRKHPNLNTQTSFTKILSEKLNVPFKNLSVPGQSQKGIILRLFNYIKNNPDDLSNTLFICGLTKFTNYSFFKKDTGEDIKYEHIKAEADSLFSKKRFDLENDYWSRIKHPSVIPFEHCSYVEMFDSYCQARKLKLVFINCYETTNKELNIQNKFLFPNNIFCWSDYINSYCSEYKDTNHHPNLFDHYLLANLLSSYIKNIF
jgi:hypothetical protein